MTGEHGHVCTGEPGHPHGGISHAVLPGDLNSDSWCNGEPGRPPSGSSVSPDDFVEHTREMVLKAFSPICALRTLVTKALHGA